MVMIFRLGMWGLIFLVVFDVLFDLFLTEFK